MEKLVKPSRTFFKMPAPEDRHSIWIFLMLAAFACGCSLRSTEQAAARTVTGIGKIANKTTVAVVKTSGQVTATTAKAVVTTSGSVAKGIASAVFVTFKDTTTGISKQIPYREGLRLYAASQTAKVAGAIATFELLRNGLAVRHGKWSSVKAGSHTDPVLSAGDVIRLNHAKPVGQKSEPPGGAAAVAF